MKALTICQPFAELIARELKRVENRSWRTHYRGPLAIHAGLSREWLGEDYGLDVDRFDFGAVIATCTLVECFSIEQIRAGDLPAEYDWLSTHDHAHGPQCWVLANVKWLVDPIPCKGRQGLWNWSPPAGVA